MCSTFYAIFALLGRITGWRTEGGRFGMSNGGPVAGKGSALCRFKGFEKYNCLKKCFYNSIEPRERLPPRGCCPPLSRSPTGRWEGAGPTLKASNPPRGRTRRYAVHSATRLSHRPYGTDPLLNGPPALKCRATLDRPSETPPPGQRRFPSRWPKNGGESSALKVPGHFPAAAAGQKSPPGARKCGQSSARKSLATFNRPSGAKTARHESAPN